MWDFGMLLAEKTIGRYIPVRFFAFTLVGGAGVLVHMAVLAALAPPRSASRTRRPSRPSSR